MSNAPTLLQFELHFTFNFQKLKPNNQYPPKHSTNHIQQLRTFLYNMTGHPFVAGSLTFRKNKN